METRLFSIREAAKEFSVREGTLRRLVKSGAVRVVKIGNRCYLRKASIEEALAAAEEVGQEAAV